MARVVDDGPGPAQQPGGLNGESEGGASNVHSNITAALLEIRSTIHKALSEAGLDETVCENAALGLGLAGVMARDDGASVRDALW